MVTVHITPRTAFDARVTNLVAPPHHCFLHGGDEVWGLEYDPKNECSLDEEKKILVLGERTGKIRNGALFKQLVVEVEAQISDWKCENELPSFHVDGRIQVSIKPCCNASFHRNFNAKVERFLEFDQFTLRNGEVWCREPAEDVFRVDFAQKTLYFSTKNEWLPIEGATGEELNALCKSIAQLDWKADPYSWMYLFACLVTVLFSFVMSLFMALFVLAVFFLAGWSPINPFPLIDHLVEWCCLGN